MRALLFAVLLLGSCHRTPGPQAPITREVLDAGGGDPAVVSPQAMRHWFLEHRRFASHIAEDCREIKDHPPGWVDRTEEKVCAAAFEAGMQAAGSDQEELP
jgi:hypothetical protein